LIVSLAERKIGPPKAIAGIFMNRVSWTRFMNIPAIAFGMLTLICVAREPLALVLHIWYAYSRDNSKTDVLADSVSCS
jgi:hypothetical protein